MNKSCCRPIHSLTSAIGEEGCGTLVIPILRFLGYEDYCTEENELIERKERPQPYEPLKETARSVLKRFNKQWKFRLVRWIDVLGMLVFARIICCRDAARTSSPWPETSIPSHSIQVVGLWAHSQPHYFNRSWKLGPTPTLSAGGAPTMSADTAMRSTTPSLHTLFGGAPTLPSISSIAPTAGFSSGSNGAVFLCCSGRCLALPMLPPLPV
jgi:hypothetical protein